MKDPTELIRALQEAASDGSRPLPDPEWAGESAPLVRLFGELLEENRSLRRERRKLIDYIRKKIDQLLVVIGTVPLRQEELDDASLINTDPIGIVADAFVQILEHQRETNAKLESAVAEIQAILESVGGGVLVLDNNLRIRAFNSSFREMFLKPGDNPVGISCQDVICQDEELVDQCPCRQARRQEAPVQLDDWRIADRYYNIVATPIISQQDGAVHGVVLLYMDVTDQKLAEAELAAEKEQLAVTLRSIAEGVITTDTAGRIVLMNPMAVKLVGGSLRTMKGRPICDVFWIVEENKRSVCVDLPREVLARGRRIERPANTILISEDGTERLITISAAPITGREKQVIGVVLVFRDITDEKKQEEELQNARKIQSLGILAGGIAHDFNNLLTGIIGNISLAKLHSPAHGKVAERLAQAEKAVSRAKDLTQQLLTFSKGGTPVRHVASITEQIRETALFNLRGSNVKCRLTIAEKLWPVNVDTGQFGQVINNLVINADQAMPEGGELVITAENITLEKPSPLPLAAGHYVRIAFADSGIGIAKDIQDRIFDPYFTTKAQGSGLGLAISYAIVKKHDGYLSVESQPGEGSVFTVYLPAVPEARAALAEQREEAEELAPPGSSPARILLMDDEALIRDIVAEILLRAGYEIETAADGGEAVGLYQEALSRDRPFDLVIMDLTVPGAMGGREAMDKLLAIDPDVRAIVSSGYSNDAVMSDYRQYGFQGVIAKPYQYRELLITIRDVLKGEDPAGGSE